MVPCIKHRLYIYTKLMGNELTRESLVIFSETYSRHGYYDLV